MNEQEDATPCADAGEWYARQARKASQLRDRIAKAKAGESDEDLGMLERRLEQAEYVGD